MRLPFILQVTGAPFLYFSESSSIFELLFRRWCCFLSFLRFDDKKLPIPFMLIITFIVFLMCVQSLSRVWLFATPWTVARQAPLSMGILQARILEWVAMPSSRGSSQPRDWTQVSRITGGFSTDLGAFWMMFCPVESCWLSHICSGIWAILTMF